VMILAANPLEDVDWLFPLMECLHIAGFALSIGTIAVVDFCVLGAGPRRQYAAQISRSLGPWTLVGLVDMLFTGPLLYLGNGGAVQYNRNPGFQFKMLCLVLAIIYHYTLHNRLIRSEGAVDGSAVAPRIAASVSLMLWCCVVFGGLFIAFTEA
jgi:hypothetical protein